MKDPLWPATSPASPETPLLEARDLQVLRGGRSILEASHLTVRSGEVLAVIGPNGAGKSTLLLALARLIRPARGQVLFRGQPLEALDQLAYRRRIGLVLQEPLLLDSSVYDNVALGLRFRGKPRQEVTQTTQEWLERLGIAHLSKRPARRLSGGEAQRTSLARAFALQPEVLLLDEPFSALDAPTRQQLLEDFQELLAATDITTVFITHDLDEALALGDQVAVFLKGQLRQTGQPDQVFNAPADAEVAAFVGVETVIPARVTACQDGQVILEANQLKLEAAGEMQVGRLALFCLRPEDVTLWPAEEGRVSSARNRLRGRIMRLAPQGPLVRVEVDCGFPLMALVTRVSAREMGFAEGQVVTAAFKASAVHLIPR